METMALVLDMIPYDAVLYILWEDVHVKFPIKTRTNQRIKTFIQDSLLTNLSKDADDYFNAANHLLMLHEDYEIALELSNKSLSITKSAHGIGQKVEILYKLYRVSEALKVANDGYQ